MKIGAFDHLDASGRPLHRHYEERLALAERYDAAGLYAYHLAEHHATPLGMAPSPAVFLSALAQRTKRLRFGATVFCLPFYNPVRLFEEICMLDQMSGGRLEFGVGRGISPIEARYMGYDPEALPAMMAEALELILRACEGGTLDFAGDHYRVEGMPIEMAPLQQPHPPLWFGVGYPEAAERCAARGANFITNLPAARVRPLTDAYRGAWSGPGEMPLIGMSRHIVIAEDEGAAMAAAAGAYKMWRESFLKLWWAHDQEPPNIRLPEDFAEMCKGGQAVVGTPAQVAERLAVQIEEAGGNYLAGRFMFGDLDAGLATRSVELFAEAVLPQLEAM